MNSLRMCISCREMVEKEKLVRIVKVKGEEPRLDMSFKAQGRGAYICKKEACIENARKRKALERAFRGQVGDEVYNRLGDIINE
ncbi:MAG: YlxR family protein [Ruminococcaceae bacterium]|nr:YlxR family protein [Oscillospiraceae bacterium]